MIVFGIILIVKLVLANNNPTADSYKDQYCTDPRTMKKHAAYTEWADVYSCTRHRCQPGGRNLAIYTVGCKRVEAPESAIECEEVVEDTNMQFPYCCTRLRCLVVVRGEVWTRVLGQPWETLPAAPWSHMYKMKKPPPGDVPFVQKNVAEGPIFELGSDNEGSRDKTLRTTGKKAVTEEPCKDVKLRADTSPDIVIALSTKDEDNKQFKIENIRQKKIHKTSRGDSVAVDEPPSEKPENSESSWTEIPQNHWTDHERSNELDALKNRAQEDFSVESELKPVDVPEKVEKSSNLQALVDAIGNRMRDIENVVQKMSEKVQQKPGEELSGEKKSDTEAPLHTSKKGLSRAKKATPDGDQYKRFTAKNRSKYLHNAADGTTEQPLFIEDSQLNGYFSDGSNNLLRRAATAKEPMTYMAPVNNRRKLHPDSAEAHKKHKRAHKKKHKGKPHKKHHKDEKRKLDKNKINSVEADRIVVSLEDSSAVVN